MDHRARSFGEAIELRATRDPDSELVRSAGARSWSAAETFSVAREVAAGLAPMVSEGTPVATALDASPEAVILSCAISLVGGIEIALPARPGEGWLKSLFDCAPWPVLIASKQRWSDDPELARVTPPGRLGVVISDGDEQNAPNLDDLRSGKPLRRRLRPRSSDPYLVVTTSGTTGRRKAAVLPNGAALGQARRVAAAMRYTPGDAVLSFFPWQHINARHAAVLPAVLTGARVVIAPRFSASRFWDLAAREGVTAFNFMGAVCAMLLRQPPGAADRDHEITRAYGGPAPRDMYEAMEDRFGVRLLQAYACTELGDVATTSYDSPRPGAAGRICDPYRVRIIGGSPVGELQVQPKDRDLTFTEYLGDPEATSAAWTDGWFRTGDLARLDEGWLFFEGRSTDVIRRRGVNISPEEVEHAIGTMPGVAEVAVVGVPSELTEEEVLAVVVPESGHAVAPADVHEACAALLPRHACPRFVSIATHLPRNESAKLLRRALKDKGLPAGCWDAEGVS